jgi:ABC-type dipeptide/oligopeptide/nickel transport system permease component
MVRLVLNTRNGGRLIEHMVVRIGKRLVQLLITLLGVTFITFSLTYMAPGDPVAMLLETGDTIISQDVVEQTRHELGLDRPFLVQYGSWLGHALTGDLGMSYSAKKPVVDKMAEAFPVLAKRLLIVNKHTVRIMRSPLTFIICNNALP